MNPSLTIGTALHPWVVIARQDARSSPCRYGNDDDDGDNDDGDNHTW